MKKKYYMFRPSGEDEGEVALLTASEYRRILNRLNKLFGDEEPYYIYSVWGSSYTRIMRTLDEAEREQKNP
jgi:hypothetical protein